MPPTTPMGVKRNRISFFYAEFVAKINSQNKNVETCNRSDKLNNANPTKTRG